MAKYAREDLYLMGRFVHKENSILYQERYAYVYGCER